MSQWVVKEFQRPDATIVNRLGAVPTGVLSDCMNRFQAMDGSIGSLVKGWKMAGPAFTVQSMEACNWGAHQALALTKPGDVLVLAARGSTMSAIWGHIMTVAAKHVGLGGVVVDGCIRDAASNAVDTLPIFSRGTCPAGPHKHWPCNINVPVSCAGVAVMPGDIIVGDDDGVVVVPAIHAAEVLAEAERKLAQEEEWYRRLEQGTPSLELVGLTPI